MQMRKQDQQSHDLGAGVMPDLSIGDIKIVSLLEKSVVKRHGP